MLSYSTRLLDQGCTVVGVEGVKTAIEDLFQAHSLTYSLTPLQNDDSLFEVYNIV